jgi:arginase
VVAFGFRDQEEQRQYRSQPLPADLRAYDLATVRRMGIEKAALAAVDHLTRPELAGFFVHLDADSLDDAVMPAVDYRITDGLSWSELQCVLSTAFAHANAVGLEVTIYNPKLDPTGAAGRGLVNVIVEALRPASSGF